MGHPIRYAVIGLGHFAQTFVLPAFKNAQKSEVAALVSADADKLATLSALHDVPHAVGYDEIERLFQQGLVDAAYITTANHLHAGIAERVACAGGHVLLETPMALTADDAENVARVCASMGRKLMVAYGSHFEPSHRAALELVRARDLGDVRSFNSVQSMQVRSPSPRTDPLTGGGPLHDLGIHCINVARSLFGSEPLEVCAFSDSAPDDSRFDGVEGAVSALLRFPEGRLGTFTVAYDAARASRYEVIGSRGRLVVEPAYGPDVTPSHRIELAEQHREKQYARTDQTLAVIEHFSDCVLNDREPAPGPSEGIADLRVLDALFKSLRERRSIEIDRVAPAPRPQEGRVVAGAGAIAAAPRMAAATVATDAPPLVHAHAPSR